MGVWIANSDAALEATRRRHCGSLLRQQGLRVVLLVGAGGAVRHRGHRQQHPGLDPGLRRGIVFCVGAAYILVFNGANVGVAAGPVRGGGQQPKFWGLILPHGLLGAHRGGDRRRRGPAPGWAIIAPGDRRRTEVLARWPAARSWSSSWASSPPSSPRAPIEGLRHRFGPAHRGRHRRRRLRRLLTTCSSSAGLAAARGENRSAREVPAAGGRRVAGTT